jgi:TolB protein
MNIKGEDVKRLTFDPRSDRVPSWSPSGDKIIWYSREVPEVAGSGNNSWDGAEIYEVNIDGSNRKQLTHNLYRDHGPIYSPNGKTILFTSGKTGTREIYRMNSDGSNIQQLTYSKK